MKNPAPDYRINIAWHVRAVLVAGLISAMVAVDCLFERRLFLGAIFVVLAGLVGLLRLTLFLITDPKRRKLARNCMVNSIQWSGNERVLDVGCGNGIVLLAVAKRLSGGIVRATGIDVWKETAGRQSAQTLRRNAEIESVTDQIEVLEADARNMPFENGTFDVIFASLSLHHAGGSRGIRQVVAEMKRVLKPGGVILIYDLYPATTAAVRILRELGIKDIEMLKGGILPALRACQRS